MKPLKPLCKRTFSRSFKVGRVILGVGLARTGWFADDDADNRTRRHHIIALRVAEQPQAIGVSVTVLPLYLMVAWRRK